MPANRRTWTLLLCCCALCGCAVEHSTPPVPPTVYLVSADGGGDFPTIQAALDNAAAGEVIELADGTYTGEGNRDLTFAGKALILRSRSGDADACVIDCQADTSSPHRAFLFLNAEPGGFEYVKTSAAVAFRSHGKLITVHGPKCGEPTCMVFTARVAV